MSETLKNRPKQKKLQLYGDCKHSFEAEVSATLGNYEDWFEGFETKMRSFRDSQIRCIEWLQKYTMIDPLDTVKLMQVQAALRTFIEKEVLGK